MKISGHIIHEINQNTVISSNLGIKFFGKKLQIMTQKSDFIAVEISFTKTFDFKTVVTIEYPDSRSLT